MEEGSGHGALPWAGHHGTLGPMKLLVESWATESSVKIHKGNVNVQRYLINYPHLSDYGQTIFCLSFPSRDRATAPGRYEQFYFTEHVPYPQKINFEDAIRSD